MFKRLTLSKWRQFEKIDIGFHEKLTILTGANASGKTTILKFIAQHFGWDLQFLRAPQKDRYKNRENLDITKDTWGDNIIDGSNETIGQITYSDDSICEIRIPNNNQINYIPQLLGSKKIPGLFIASHRPIPLYRGIDVIPLNLQTTSQVYEKYYMEGLQRFRIGSNNSKPSIFQLKEYLIQLALYGYGNEAVEKNQNAIDTFEGFEDILRIVLPPKIGFESISIRIPEVILETKSGEFPIDSVSGGIASLIDISWQIYIFSEKNEEFVVVIDEPENHLHPELQRMVLPNLMKAFPYIQFIVASHNPFIIGSVKDSNIYVLQYNEKDKIVSELLDTANRSGTSNEILQNVLGLGDIFPIWVSEKLEEIIDTYSQLDINEENLNKMREELEENGLDNVVTKAITRVVRGGDDSSGKIG